MAPSGTGGRAAGCDQLQRRKGFLPSAGAAGPAGEEAGDLVGGVSLEGGAADVVAGQGGLRGGGGQQALDVAQRNALVEPDGPDRAAQRVRPDRPGDPGDLSGEGDVAVHRAAVHAGAGAGARSSGPLVRPAMAACTAGKAGSGTGIRA